MLHGQLQEHSQPPPQVCKKFTAAFRKKWVPANSSRWIC